MMRENEFVMSLDETTLSGSRFYSVCVQTVDGSFFLQKIQMDADDSNDSEYVKNMVIRIMNQNHIPAENFVALALDNVKFNLSAYQKLKQHQYRNLFLIRSLDHGLSRALVQGIDKFDLGIFFSSSNSIKNNNISQSDCRY